MMVDHIAMKNRDHSIPKKIGHRNLRELKIKLRGSVALNPCRKNIELEDTIHFGSLCFVQEHTLIFYKFKIGDTLTTHML